MNSDQMKTGKLILKIFTVIIVSVSLFYAFLFCKKSEESGIKIGYVFTVEQNYLSNYIFRSDIRKAINQNENGLINLLEVSTDGESSYEMGFIMSQIVYKIGEENFINMIKKLNSRQKSDIYSYIEVGLLYGDQNNDGEFDDKRIEKEFPLIFEYFKSMHDK